MQFHSLQYCFIKGATERVRSILVEQKRRSIYLSGAGLPLHFGGAEATLHLSQGAGLPLYFQEELPTFGYTFPACNNLYVSQTCSVLAVHRAATL